jgi:hypothetical protein
VEEVGKDSGFIGGESGLERKVRPGLGFVAAAGAGSDAASGRPVRYRTKDQLLTRNTEWTVDRRPHHSPIGSVRTRTIMSCFYRSKLTGLTCHFQSPCLGQPVDNKICFFLREEIY